jgi:drug/metabolite transporter (DMT)-like permease
MTGLAFVRIWLPAAIAVAGVLLVAFGGDAARGAGIVLIGVAALVVLANLFIRLGLLSERDREREQERRRSFTRRGRWPDEP